MTRRGCDKTCKGAWHTVRCMKRKAAKPELFSVAALERACAEANMRGRIHGKEAQSGAQYMGMLDACLAVARARPR